MAKIYTFAALAFMCALALSIQAHAQAVPFDSGRWEIQAKESKVMEHLGRRGEKNGASYRQRRN